MISNQVLFSLRPSQYFFRFQFSSQTRSPHTFLGCTDEAKHPLYPHLSWLNAAMHEGCYYLNVGATSSFFFFFFSRIVLTRRRLRLIRADLDRIKQNRRFRPKFKKKKKKWCKTHCLNLITNPKFSHAFFTSNFSSLSLVSLCSLCSLPLCLCSPSPL